MSIDASFHGSRETTRPLEVDTRRQAVETAVPPATLPRVYHQQLHPAAYANSSLARASPAAQVPVMKLSNKRPRLPEDNALGGNGPVNNYSSSLVPAKKSNTRASQACDSCRQLKVKCDETKPCKSCKEKGHECKYGDPAPKTTNKAQAGFSACIGQLDQRLTAVEAILTKHLATSEPKLEPSVEDEDGRAPVSSFATNDASTDPANFRSIATPVLERRPSSAPR
ncbi:uncharacterized protein BKA55DRAFT_145546 [Fusarium redolens]|uniref:Zn(2)-C6 fungal-type domain-containing protein n=1 Tax=Fusarium redolens TaxID=48865 RepID=A0A9P9JR82_FUSRE|nr:uncharacterized protein BKA55DRAFT_145546 [Fusarium redolens]KAH7233998.1 hypothetical protein BKA55DRAFT_145546 [Fusarium redolens]